MEADYSKYKILIVDDEKDILEFISYNLKKLNFNVYTANSGLKAIEMAKTIHPHLILLDIMMPEMDGVETCEELRKVSDLDKTIIAFLSDRGEDYSQIAAFEAGGDDYITKPVRPKVLINRIKALLKRYTPAEKREGSKTGNITQSGFIIDKERFVVVKNGKDIVLPKKEFELLNLLISKPEKVFTRKEIFHAVWGDKIIVGDRTIDVHIRKLREKIGENYIQTIKGVGYKFVDKFN